MSVIFYEMPGCGYCVKAKTLLADEINKGVVVVKPSSQAPSGVNGFPYFENKSNGKTHMGYPGTVEALFEKLNVSYMPVVAVAENFVAARVSHVPNTAPTHKFWVGIV